MSNFIVGTMKAVFQVSTSGTLTMDLPVQFCSKNARTNPIIQFWLWANFWVAVSSANESTGSWDSIHVFEATDRPRISHYKLTSTVILNMINGDESLGEMDLSGNMTRQVEQDMPVEDDSSHIANIGKVFPSTSVVTC